MKKRRIKNKVLTIRESKLNSIKHLYYAFGFFAGSASATFLLSDYVMLFTGWGVGFSFN